MEFAYFGEVLARSCETPPQSRFPSHLLVTDLQNRTAGRLIEEYKRVRETVQHGSLYRLMSPRDGREYSATESVALDRSQPVLFAFLHSSQMGYPFPTLYLRGLDPDSTYVFTAIAGKVQEGTPQSASGRYWMQHGFNLALRGDFQAAAFCLELVRAQRP